MPIPQDPVILLSYLNTQLRDNYTSLEELCRTMQLDKETICAKIQQIGYRYAPQHNQFIRG